MAAKDTLIFLIEADLALQNKIKTLISSMGHTVFAFDVAQAALDELEASPKGVALIISSYRMPKMRGDQVLRKARAISSQSQRMLISETSDMEVMVNAVNTAEIHSCIVLPFTDNELVNQVKTACDRYKSTLKKENLTQVTRRQNKQLFEIARDLKKTDEQQLREIQQRELTIEKMKTKMDDDVADDGAPAPLTCVEDYLTRREIEIHPKMLAAHLRQMQDQIKIIFSDLVSEEHGVIDDLSYQEIRGAMARAEFKTPAAGMMVPVLNLIPSDLTEDENEDEDEDFLSFTAEGLLDDYLELGTTQDGSKAFVKIKRYDPKMLSLKGIKAFLIKNQVISGLIPDSEILSWIKGASTSAPPFAIALGRPPKLPRNAKVRYHFETEYLQPGKLKDDGTIDFTDRGKIPFVEKDTFLAAKIPSEPGIPGMTVSGVETPVPEPEDICFEAGPGARLSEDENKIYADTDGQPSLDALGTVSVLSELEIKGDVDFETGNIDFDGNLTVKGSVKEGFKVNAASLTCTQVEGGQINLTGDLNCSAGIINATLVKVNGNIQAKYINNSTVDSFGDLMIQKEIIDSKIQTSGRVINSGGSILASEISAKGGIEAGNVGTAVSKPSKLTVGMDLYVNALIAKCEAAQENTAKTISEIVHEVSELYKEDSDLHASISEKAYVQDRAQLELKDIEKKKANLKASGNMLAYHKILETIKKVEKRAKQAEEKIERDFQRQDAISHEMVHKKKRVKELETEIKASEKEKFALLEMTARKESRPEVIVKRRIMPGNVINGPNTTMPLMHAQTRCKIFEIKHVDEGHFFYEMQVGSL